MGVFVKIILDIIPICTWLFVDECNTIISFLQYEAWQLLFQCFFKMVWRYWKLFNKVPACLKIFCFKTDLHCCSTLSKTMDCPWSFYQIAADDQSSSPEIQKDKMLCYQFIWCLGSFYSWYPCNILVLFAVTISSQEQWLSKCCHTVCFLPSCLYFPHNFITLPLQCSESIYCRMKTVLNVMKGFTNFSLYPF